MGVNLYTYVGAYVKLPKVVVSMNSVGYCCSNDKCKNNQNMNNSFTYCPVCGNLGVFKENRENKNLDFSSFCEENDLAENFNSIEIGEDVFLLPDISDSGRLLDFYEEGGYSFNTSDMIFAKQQYEEKFADYQTKFKEIYNVNLAVEFGVVSYWS